MSVRPLDMALTVQRTPEIKSTQAVEGARSEVAMQQSADTLKKDVQMLEQNVMQSNKSEETNVNRDGRGNSGYGGSSGKKGKKDGLEKEAKPVKHTGILDISI